MATKLQLNRVRPNEDGDIAVPAAQTSGAAGLDLPAAVPTTVVLQPGEFLTIPTGFAVEIPAGFEGQVRPRSGLAARHGITLLNSPGTIDADYRGEVKVIVINHSKEPFMIERGMRIAQMVIARVVNDVQVIEVNELSGTQRGAGGFGSTGTLQS